ncbi:MAG: MarR family transcriptional regulator [Clostridiales Family XIII bacterium]|jgi:DNA-binding transcriptional regulator LsrR (DeoR family)|nr:MarR family transcriptional regulator [Clostridiales Family XIII bacterium]
MLNDRSDLLVRVAELYYQQDLNQAEISKMLGISRPTVSRLLDEAKDAGVVEIIVHSPVRKDPALSFKLRNLLNIRDVLVISGTNDAETSLNSCCISACQFLGTVLSNNMTLGITWGPATQIFGEVLQEKKYYNVNVVQMAGCLGTGNPATDGMELAINISRKLGGTYSNIYSPLDVSNETVYNYLIEDVQIKTSLKRAMHTDIIVTGIGSLDTNTILQRSGYITDRDRMALIGKGAVGHLMARPIDINGAEIKVPNRFVISSELKAMRNAQWSIGIATTMSKVESSIAACRGGYINILIINHEVAEAIVAYLEGN